MKDTACPRSSDPFYVETYYIYSIVYSDPFYVETYYIKWVNTTWTFKQYMRQFLIYLVKFLLILYVQEVVTKFLNPNFEIVTLLSVQEVVTHFK